jgi:hypothetical protein
MTDFETINSELNVLRVAALQGYVKEEFDKEQMLYAKYDVINFAKQLHLGEEFINELLEEYNRLAQFSKI